MNILELAKKQEKYVISNRRYLHQHPELSWQEWETTAFIEKELQAMGIEPHRFDDKHTGLWAMIEGGQAGPDAKTIMLRADIDALPVQEKNTDISYASQVPGVMHACGHDAHTMMLLGAAKVLLEIKDQLKGNVKLLFQAAEETMVGSKYYVEQGVMDDVDAVYASHISSWMDVGTISVDPGPRAAATDEFALTVHGVGCHGGMPHLGTDSIVAASAIVMNLQTLVSRRTDALDSLIITVGKIAGGQSYNIIPDHVELIGTVRTYSREVRAKVPTLLEDLAQNTAKAFGCTATLDYIRKAPPVIHDDPQMNRISKDAVLKLFGQESLVSSKPVGGGDDVAYYLEKAPGIFAFIGARNETLDCIYGHHHPKFNLDESSFVNGVAMYAQVAHDFLADEEPTA